MARKEHTEYFIVGWFDKSSGEVVNEMWGFTSYKEASKQAIQLELEEPSDENDIDTRVGIFKLIEIVEPATPVIKKFPA